MVVVLAAAVLAAAVWAVAAVVVAASVVAVSAAVGMAVEVWAAVVWAAVAPVVEVVEVEAQAVAATARTVVVRGETGLALKVMDSQAEVVRTEAKMAEERGGWEASAATSGTLDTGVVRMAMAAMEMAVGSAVAG